MWAPSTTVYRVITAKVRWIGGGGNTSALEWFFKPIHLPLVLTRALLGTFWSKCHQNSSIPLLHFWVLKSHHSAAFKTHRPTYYHRHLKGKASFPFSVSTSSVRTWSGVLRHISMDCIRTPKCLTATEDSFDKQLKLDGRLEVSRTKGCWDFASPWYKRAEQSLSWESPRTLILGSNNIRKKQFSRLSIKRQIVWVERVPSVVSFGQLQHLKKWTII